MRTLRVVGLISLIALLNAATVAILLSGSRPSAAGPPTSDPCVPGDVNGDGILDLSDPIGLIGYIFEGTPEPIACAQARDLTGLDAILAQFRPRASDLFYSHHELSPNQPVDLVTVPPGQIFVITYVAEINSAAGLTFERNAQEFPLLLIYDYFTNSANVLVPRHEPLKVPLQPGDVLTVTNNALDSRGINLFGYWADAP